MDLSLLNPLGDWNPQVLRELKGRLKPAPLFLCIGAAVVLQGFLILVATELNPREKFSWDPIFHTLNWLLPVILLVAGVFLLTSDIAKEARQGTLNFIRFSPQSSQSILFGKLIGVPSLIYLFVALCLPLHCLASLQTYSLPSIFAVYCLWGVGCTIAYTLALLFGMIGYEKMGEQARAGGASVLALMFGPYYFQVINMGWEGYREGAWNHVDLSWFVFSFNSAEVTFGLTFISGAIATYWIWCSVNRLYRNPQGTKISKSQSYGIVTSLQVWVLGFLLPLPFPWARDAYFALFGVTLGNLMLILLITFALTPERQLCLDWSRYRHQQLGQNRQLLHDLVWGEKSPSVVAIALQILLITAIWSIWAIMDLPNPEKTWAIVSLILTANLMFIYVAIIQLSLLNRSKKREAIAGASLLAGLVLPIIFLALFNLPPLDASGLWMSSVFGGAWFVLEETGKILIFPTLFSLCAQWTAIALLNTTLIRNLKKMGASTTQTLLQEPSRRLISSP